MFLKKHLRGLSSLKIAKNSGVEPRSISGYNLPSDFWIKMRLVFIIYLI